MDCAQTTQILFLDGRAARGGERVLENKKSHLRARERAAKSSRPCILFFDGREKNKKKTFFPPETLALNYETHGRTRVRRCRLRPRARARARAKYLMPRAAAIKTKPFITDHGPYYTRL